MNNKNKKFSTTVRRGILVATCIVSLWVYGVILHHGHGSSALPAKTSPSSDNGLMFNDSGLNYGSSYYGPTSVTVDGPEYLTNISVDPSGNLSIIGNLSQPTNATVVQW